MSDVRRLRLVQVREMSGADVIEKLRRELYRIEAADDADVVRDHVMNAFWSAWHVHQWMWDAIKRKPSVKRAVLKYRGIDSYNVYDRETFGSVLASRYFPLKICRVIATSSRFVHLDPTDAETALSSSVQLTPMLIVMGRPISATRLLIEVDDYWVTMILDCGVD